MISALLWALIGGTVIGLLGKAGRGIEDSPVPAACLGKLLDLIRS